MEFSFPIAILGLSCLNLKPAARGRAWSFETGTRVFFASDKLWCQLSTNFVKTWVLVYIGPPITHVIGAHPVNKRIALRRPLLLERMPVALEF